LRCLLVVFMLLLGACAQEAPSLTTRSGEVYLAGSVAGVDVGEGVLKVAVARIQGARGAGRRLDPPVVADLRLSLFGRPPCLTRTDTVSFLRRVVAGAGIAAVIAKGDPDLPGVLPVLDLAVDGQPPLGRPKAPWPALGATTSGESVTVPMGFPVVGSAVWNDTWLKPVGGQPHIGQDLKGPRMTPLVACFGGLLWVKRAPSTASANSLVLIGDDGWQALYTHLNNDTPGTKDNAAGPELAFAPGIETGARVVAGQLLGWMGDSGFATGPHLHFELRGADKQVRNAAPSLRAATSVSAPAAVPLWPDLKPSAGQVRLDGHVMSVNVADSRLYLGVRQRNGSALSGPMHVVVRLRESTRLLVRGQPDGALALAQVPVGAAMAVLARDEQGLTFADRVEVERQGVMADDALRAAVDAAARAGA